MKYKVKELDNTLGEGGVYYSSYYLYDDNHFIRICHDSFQIIIFRQSGILFVNNKFVIKP